MRTGSFPERRAPSGARRGAGAAALAAAALAAACAPQPTASAEAPLAWTAPLPAPSSGVPVAGEGMLVVGTDSGVVAFDLESGARRWEARVLGMVGERLLLRDGRVFVAGVRGVRALDARTGRQLWEVPLAPAAGADFAEAAVDARAVYVGTRDRRVVALAVETGRTLWDAPIGAADWVGGMVSGLTLAGDTVYAAVARDLTANRHRITVVVAALDRASGRELWRHQSAEERTAPYAAPVEAGPLLVTGGAAEGPVLAVDRSTGREAWRRQLWGYAWGKPVLHGGRLHVVTQAARAYALDPASGRVLWEAELGAGARYAEPCGGQLVVPNYHIDLLAPESGRRVRRVLTATDQEFAAGGLAVAGNVAYVPAQRNVYAIRCR